MRAIGASVVLIALLLSVIGCAPSTTEKESLVPVETEFAVYLTAQEVPIDSLAIVTHIDPGDEPIVSIEDIVSYRSQTHEIELTPSSAKRIVELDLAGKAFVVCVDRQPIYAGVFMALYFSRTFDGIVIIWPPTQGDGTAIRIELGYPGPEFFTGEDPRSDPKIFESLRQAGKLH